MHLDREEERILNGEEGPAKALALKAIVKVGESLNATRLVKIGHAHISGISYNNIGEPGLKFLKQLASMGAKTVVTTTVNPIGMDLDKPLLTGADEYFYKKQIEILEILKKINTQLTLTCIPYYVRKPSPNEHLAWGESSAVAYANSIIGARTNREGGPLALFAAITGRTYYAGLHVLESRRVTHRIVLDDVALRLANEYQEVFLGVLGAYIASNIKEGIPLLDFHMLKTQEWFIEGVKQLCASMGTYGNISMCVIKDITPPGTYLDNTDAEKIVVDQKALTKYLLGGTVEDVEMFFLGCPHTSLDTLNRLKNLVRKYTCRAKKQFFVALPRGIYNSLPRSAREFFEKKGITLIRDTCLVVAPLKNLGIRRIATNSMKTKFYLERLHNIDVAVYPLSKLVHSAFEGCT